MLLSIFSDGNWLFPLLVLLALLGTGEYITRANITDRDGAIALVTLNLEQFKLVRTMMVDSGYTGQNFANEISSLTSAKVIVVK